LPAVASGSSRSAKQPLDTSRLVGLSVLLAEDNAINQLVAKKMLAGLGMKVVVAANGQEAVAAIESGAAAAAAAGEGGEPPGDAAAAAAAARGTGYAVVLMDLLMPVMDGLEATTAIRAAGYTVPIVAMTANAGDKDRAECAAAGMDGFLPKPVLRDQLAGAILAVLPAAGAAVCRK
jgi:CheY-like chemotaxis protein